MDERHIVTSFDEKLAALRDMVVQMGELAGRQLERALLALEQDDAEAAHYVIGADAEIDALDDRIKNQTVLLLALQAPVADDLRTAVTALRISGDLERIADHARNIAKRTMALRAAPAHPPSQSVVQMGRMVRQLVADVMDAYKTGDETKAMAAWHQDQAVDGLYSGAFRELLTYMMEDSRLLAAASHLVFVAKDIERIGDHATNIGEMIHFLVTGHPLVEARPKADTTTTPQAD